MRSRHPGTGNTDCFVTGHSRIGLRSDQKRGELHMDQKLNIMVVDDEAIVGKRLKPTLERDGYGVETFGDGTSALDRIGQKDFDIIVTDVRMDDVDGMTVLAHSRKRSPFTEVIMVTEDRS